MSKWNCYPNDDEPDHDWRVKSDSNEAGEWFWWECAQCGKEDFDRPVTNRDLIDEF